MNLVMDEAEEVVSKPEPYRKPLGKERKREKTGQKLEALLTRCV